MHLIESKIYTNEVVTYNTFSYGMKYTGVSSFYSKKYNKAIKCDRAKS